MTNAMIKNQLLSLGINTPMEMWKCSKRACDFHVFVAERNNAERHEIFARGLGHKVQRVTI